MLRLNASDVGSTEGFRVRKEKRLETGQARYCKTDRSLRMLGSDDGRALEQDRGQIGRESASRASVKGNGPVGGRPEARYRCC
jgi:hypothetical protein